MALQILGFMKFVQPVSNIIVQIADIWKLTIAGKDQFLCAL